ncbi:GLPGLI family protein [Chryseobacterium sp. WG23]|uniref:GLPGLI family protein n=1 Tax=Chryseobacterium sp. WG23 TaxID=2926910 RepID=UPI00211E9205|nr:GLPGLI family protein [Chryseobacterium sp. WG23]MCQ9633868.1 GLPGLI family protein [Chryseobacterium sp. WG23]
MKNLLLFCFFLPSIYFSQNIRLTYNYKFVTDTLKRDIITDEIVVLDFNNKEKQSIFTGLKHIISDSTMAVMSKKGVMLFPDASMKIKYVVEKNNDGIIYFYTPNHMANPVLKVKDDRKIDWKISNEKEKILEYTTQKATANFAGREWTAWFTTELPVSDGPYKFCGLPGLILKVYDKTNTHSFEIISLEKQKSNYVVLNDDTYKDVKPITLNEYKEISKKSPLERYRDEAFTGDIIFKSNEEKQNFLKNLDVKIKESKIHDNNPIELN